MIPGLICRGTIQKEVSIYELPLFINNTSPSVSVASRPLFVRVSHYVTQLTAASRPFSPPKHTNNNKVNPVVVNYPS